MTRKYRSSDPAKILTNAMIDAMALKLDAQLTLDFKHRARRKDPETSHIAAAGSSHKPGRYVLVIEALRSLYGQQGTCYEIAKAASMTHVDVARRMKNLEGRGYVIRTDKRRIGDCGFPCTVWQLASGLDEIA